MVEALGVGESVTVEVTRANPVSNIFGTPAPVTAPTSSASASATAVSVPTVYFPTEYIFILIGVIVAAAFVFLAFKKYRSGDIEFPKRYTNIKFPDAINVSSKEFSINNKWVRAILFSFIVGFVGMILSGTGIAWTLAVVIFYYEFFVKGNKN